MIHYPLFGRSINTYNCPRKAIASKRKQPEKKYKGKKAVEVEEISFNTEHTLARKISVLQRNLFL
jgi:hypothetical protein